MQVYGFGEGVYKKLIQQLLIVSISTCGWDRIEGPIRFGPIVMKRSGKIALSLTAFLLVSGSAMGDFNPFASQLINISLNGPNEPVYLPAPGQRVNISPWKIAENSLGTPRGGGTQTPNNDEVVTLGGFGGQIVLAFDHDVENNPANPMGLDAIVFSNALWYDGDPNLHWAEFATIEIMSELNDNNIPGNDPGEQWYIIPGSCLSDADTWRTQHWARGTINGYPAYTGWPDDYNTSAYELFPQYQDIGTPPTSTWVFINPNSEDADPSNDYLEGWWGYAEYTPTLLLGDRNADDFNNAYSDAPNMPPELFYTIPDDPYTVGISAGSGGGDAFDISWAVDPCTWQPANLQTFRYIRLTTAVDIRQLGVLGEISAEIDAVADVRLYGDINGDNKVDYIDLALLAQTWLSEWSQQDFNPAADFAVDNKIDFLDYAKFAFGFNP